MSVEAMVGYFLTIVLSIIGWTIGTYWVNKQLSAQQKATATQLVEQHRQNVKLERLRILQQLRIDAADEALRLASKLDRAIASLVAITEVGAEWSERQLDMQVWTQKFQEAYSQVDNLVGDLIALVRTRIGFLPVPFDLYKRLRDLAHDVQVSSLSVWKMVVTAEQQRQEEISRLEACSSDLRNCLDSLELKVQLGVLDGLCNPELLQRLKEVEEKILQQD